MLFALGIILKALAPNIVNVKIDSLRSELLLRDNKIKITNKKTNKVSKLFSGVTQKLLYLLPVLANFSILFLKSLK